MIGSGHEELEESYTGEFTLNAKPDAPVVFDGERALLRAQPSRDVSLDVRAGEILGIYGFMGCGVVELTRALFGKIKPDRRLWRSTARRCGFRNTVEGAQRRARLRAGKPALMLFHHEPIYKNATISILKRISPLWLKPRTEREIAARHVEALRIKTAERRRAARPAFRRQPAEGGAGEMADACRRRC